MHILMLLTISAVMAAPVFPPELVNFSPSPANPVFEEAGPGHWDEHIRERGWILFEDGKYRLWYTGYSEQDKQRKMGLATSGDGIHWVRSEKNPIYAETWVEDMTVVRQGATYYMFAESENDEAYLLSSADGLAWKREGRLDIRKQDGSPIAPGPFGTPAVYLEGDTWHLFYERNDEAVWLATSKDLKVWTNVQDEPVMKPGPAAYDAGMIAMDQVIKYQGRYYAYYHGLVPNTKPQEWTSAVAVSEDLIHWEKYAGNPLVAGDKSSPEIVQTPEGFRLYTMHPAVYFHKATTAD